MIRCRTCRGTLDWNEKLERWYHEPFEMWMLQHEAVPDWASIDAELAEAEGR